MALAYLTQGQNFTYVKNKTSQFPYGSCGLKNKNQINPLISPYSYLNWTQENINGQSYFIVNLEKKLNACEGFNSLDCDPTDSSMPCSVLCEFAETTLDALHIPLNNDCLATPAQSSGPCTALIVQNHPGAGLFNSDALNSWNPISIDFNPCNGIVTQGRFNLKGYTAYAQATAKNASHLFQFAIPTSFFNLKKCPGIKEICQSETPYSDMQECAVAPYLNTNYKLPRNLVGGGHEFCPVIVTNPDAPNPSQD
jgi:hypothetical protein